MADKTTRRLALAAFVVSLMALTVALAGLIRPRPERTREDRTVVIASLAHRRATLAEARVTLTALGLRFNENNFNAFSGTELLRMGQTRMKGSPTYDSGTFLQDFAWLVPPPPEVSVDRHLSVVLCKEHRSWLESLTLFPWEFECTLDVSTDGRIVGASTAWVPPPMF